MSGYIKCQMCGRKITYLESYRKVDSYYFCGDCSFIAGLIDSKTLKKEFYYFIPEDIIGEPVIKNGKIEFVSKSFIKAKTNNNFRRTPEYRKWRNEVYKRDNYTCQICGQKGGKLNAHHIKLFSKHKELRIDVKNGITLCEKCHKEIHRGNNERLYQIIQTNSG